MWRRRSSSARCAGFSIALIARVVMEHHVAITERAAQSQGNFIAMLGELLDDISEAARAALDGDA
jgi:hypothetical protein